MSVVADLQLYICYVTSLLLCSSALVKIIRAKDQCRAGTLFMQGFGKPSFLDQGQFWFEPRADSAGSEMGLGFRLG